jgi:nicotinamide-nucleotide amidase
VKFEVLGVTPGPVNTASCAQEMAVGVRALLDADVAVAVTGVGGPGPDEGVGAGTFFLAVATRDGRVGTEERHVDGGPAKVVEIAAEACLRGLCGVLDPDSDSSEVWAPSPAG